MAYKSIHIPNSVGVLTRFFGHVEPRMETIIKKFLKICFIEKVDSRHGYHKQKTVFIYVTKLCDVIVMLVKREYFNIYTITIFISIH